MIQIQNISKSFLIPHEQRRSIRGSIFSFFRRTSYERIEVLKEFSLQVKNGEFLGIMGPNGSGKSTLLKIMAGIYSPDKGEMKISGSISAILELGIGFHTELSARDNVFLQGSLLGISPSKLQQKFHEIFVFSELASFIDTPLKHFSSGMAARLAFAVAMQVEADIYLMDEVLAVGDSAFQKKCLDVFEDFRRRGKTLVFVSHSEELVKQLCDRVVYINL